MDNAEKIILTPKQTLILFFIESGFADSQYTLVKHLGRSSYFPSELSLILSPLLKHSLIKVSEFAQNGTPFRYAITEDGRNHLNIALRTEELMDFARGYSDSDFMFQIMSDLIKNRG